MKSLGTIWDEFEEFQAVFEFDDGEAYWSEIHPEKKAALDEEPLGSKLVELKKRTIKESQWESIIP